VEAGRRCCGWRATVCEDGETPRALQRCLRTVTAATVLTLPDGAAGGAAVILEPLP
jgi:hypothetical protein